jgi:hypothetical protein
MTTLLQGGAQGCNIAIKELMRTCLKIEIVFSIQHDSPCLK